MNEKKPIPPLAWVPLFTSSMERALGCQVIYTIKETVNPLKLFLKLSFSEPQSPTILFHIWNSLQMWAYSNDTLLQGKLNKNPISLEIFIIIKRLRGIPSTKEPK